MNGLASRPGIAAVATGGSPVALVPAFGRLRKPARETGVVESWGEWAGGVIRCSVRVPEDGLYDFFPQIGDALSNRGPEPKPGPPVVSISTVRERPSALGLPGHGPWPAAGAIDPAETMSKAESAVPKRMATP